MILWVLAIGGLFLVIASVRWRRFIFRSLLVALCVTVGLSLWLVLGRHNLYVAWAPFVFLPAAGFAWWKARDARSEKRRVRTAFRDELGDDGKPAVPKVESVEHASEGVIRYRLTLPSNQNFRGLSPTEIAKVQARWEWLLDCRKVTIHPDTLRGRQGSVTVDYLPEPPEPDYTGDLGQWPGWPGADDFSQPIPLGVDVRTGRPVGLRLFANGMKNILIFGVPGSGKSVGAAEIIATAAQDPTVDIWGLDGGGGTDMEFWRLRMSHYEVKVERAFLMIQELKAEIDRRSEAMVAARRRVIDPHDPKILLVMEEFATFTDEKRKRCIATGEVRNSKDDDPSESFADALAYVGRLGRKYGVGLVLITQVPTVKTIPGQLRGLVQYAWGFRCRDRGGWHAGFGGGVPFMKLDKRRPGTSVLLAENDDGLLMRAYYISDNELEEIASATSLAPPVPLAHGSEALSDDLCLENAENVVAMPVEHAATPAATPAAHVPDDWDRALLGAAVFPHTDAELFAMVPGKAPSTARKARKTLVDAGLLSALPRPSVTAPQSYQTTLTGRTAVEVGNIPDGSGDEQASESTHQPTEGGG